MGFGVSISWRSASRSVRVLTELADLGYEGATDVLRVPFKKPKGGALTDDQKTYNKLLRGVRGIGERANALLIVRFKALRRVSLDPWRIGAITAADLVLLHHETTAPSEDHAEQPKIIEKGSVTSRSTFAAASQIDAFRQPSAVIRRPHNGAVPAERTLMMLRAAIVTLGYSLLAAGCSSSNNETATPPTAGALTGAMQTPPIRTDHDLRLPYDCRTRAGELLSYAQFGGSRGLPFRRYVGDVLYSCSPVQAGARSVGS